jgi:hypothetical protein
MPHLRKTHFWLMALGLAGVAATGCAALPASSPAAELAVIVQKPEDRVLLTLNDGGLTLDVWSESGIGRATVDLVSGQMPQPVVMRFHLAGLEQMTFAYGDTAIRLSVPGGADRTALHSVLLDGQERVIGPESPYWMAVAQPAPAGDSGASFFEVTAPLAFYTSSATSFSVSWIDFFR